MTWVGWQGVRMDAQAFSEAPKRDVIMTDTAIVAAQESRGRHVAKMARDALAALRIAAAAHWPLLAGAVVSLLMVRGIIAPLDAPRQSPILMLAGGLLSFFALPLAAYILAVHAPWKLIRLAREGYQGPVLPELLRSIGRTFLHPGRVLNFVIFVIIIALFQKAALDLKANIPALNPFSWDETFMHLDRALHSGTDPWRLLQPVMGHPVVTFLANFAYNIWFFFMTGVWFWLASSKRHGHFKNHFLAAFMLTWAIGGGIMALAFSSAGPVYYGRLGLSPDPFAPLMSYLHGVKAHYPLWALDVQEMLWRQFTTADADFDGISAFPSMHNAIAALLALAAWRVSRKLGIFMTAFAAIILLASVHLGWHYAVDGYAGIAIAIVCWKLGGVFADWMQRRPETRRYRALLRKLDKASHA